MEINESSGFEVGNDFDFLPHKAATIDQMCANSVSTFKLKSLLLKILKMKKKGFMAAPYQPLKQRTCF